MFGLANVKPVLFKLDRLWLEIPLKAEATTLFSMHPNSATHLADGTEIPNTDMSASGKIPELSAAMPFKTLLWLGNEDMGLGFFAENDRNWQPESTDRAVELVRDGNTLTLRIRLIDGQPRAWSGDPRYGCVPCFTAYFPVRTI